MSQRKCEREQEGMKDGENRHAMTFTLTVREESTRQSGNQNTLNHSVSQFRMQSSSHQQTPHFHHLTQSNTLMRGNSVLSKDSSRIRSHT